MLIHELSSSAGRPKKWTANKPHRDLGEVFTTSTANKNPPWKRTMDMGSCGKARRLGDSPRLTTSAPVAGSSQAQNQQSHLQQDIKVAANLYKQAHNARELNPTLILKTRVRCQFCIGKTKVFC
jgi:hypothetical protein